MATMIETRKFIKSDANKNNNKFWYIEIYDDNTVITRYGRVGDKGQSKTKSFDCSISARNFYDAKIREKQKSRNGEIPYRPLDVIDSSVSVVPSSAPVGAKNLSKIAQDQIETNNPLTKKLIEYFTKVNAHNIEVATGGQITYNYNQGQFQTPLGLVGQKSIDEANNILVEIGDLVSAGTYSRKLVDLTNDYLMLVPQNIGRKKLDVEDFWESLAKVQAQKAIVDSLQASLVTALNNPDDSGQTEDNEPKLFSVQLFLIEDDYEIKTIQDFYRRGLKKSHVSSHLDVKRVYRVKINTVHEAFAVDGGKMDNQWILWHGTRASNCLSILRGGLVIPPSSSAHCTGRMFGDGVYASDISTKALNYAYGYWGGKKKDDNCFMFLLTMAMGNYYTPSSYGYTYRKAKPGYDSTFAKAGTGGVINNEMIVYRTSQVDITHLVEFTPGGK